MVFPPGRPDGEPVFLWHLQNELLQLVENLLGRRDVTKKIYRPVFHADGPRLHNMPDGAFVGLSLNAAGYWPTAVYEMGHETVHLLNPTEGYTNWLEEGVAVAFSQRALAHYGLEQPPLTLATYMEALSLVQELPGGAFGAPQAARLAAGALNAVTFEQLRAAAPAHAKDKLDRLVSQCVSR